MHWLLLAHFLQYRLNQGSNDIGIRTWQSYPYFCARYLMRFSGQHPGFPTDRVPTANRRLSQMGPVAQQAGDGVVHPRYQARMGCHKV